MASQRSRDLQVIKRDIRIVALRRRGLSYAKIGDELNISPSTVRNAVRRALIPAKAKLAAEAELARREEIDRHEGLLDELPDDWTSNPQLIAVVQKSWARITQLRGGEVDQRLSVSGQIKHAHVHATVGLTDAALEQVRSQVLGIVSGADVTPIQHDVVDAELIQASDD